MNYAELVKAVAGKADVSEAEAKRVISALTDTVKDTVAKNQDSVKIANFGAFQKTEIKERVYGSGALAGKVSPAHYRIKFVPYSDFVEALPKPKSKKKTK